MEKDANYFAVGLFVSISLVALVGFLIWLAGMSGGGNMNRFTIYFTDSVSGLSDEGIVKYKGVDVGKVLNMRLAEDRFDVVKVDIEVKDTTPIGASTEAKIAMQGITGQSTIELATASGDRAPPRVVEGEKYPVLKGSGSAMSRFMDELPQVANQLQTTLSAIDAFSRGSTKMVESMRDLADTLKEDPSQVLHGPSHKGVVIPK